MLNVALHCFADTILTSFGVESILCGFFCWSCFAGHEERKSSLRASQHAEDQRAAGVVVENLGRFALARLNAELVIAY